MGPSGMGGNYRTALRPVLFFPGILFLSLNANLKGKKVFHKLMIEQQDLCCEHWVKLRCEHSIKLSLRRIRVLTR